MHSVFGKINYGGLKHNSLYLGPVLPSGGGQSLIRHHTQRYDTHLDDKDRTISLTIFSIVTLSITIKARESIQDTQHNDLRITIKIWHSEYQHSQQQ